MQRGADVTQGIREAAREGRQAAQCGDSVQSCQGRRAGGQVHQDERAADASVRAAGEPDYGSGEALPGDLPLDRRFLGGQGRVGHDPQDQRVRWRRDVGQAHQAHRGPEAAGESLRCAGKLSSFEAGFGS